MQTQIPRTAATALAAGAVLCGAAAISACHSTANTDAKAASAQGQPDQEGVSEGIRSHLPTLAFPYHCSKSKMPDHLFEKAQMQLLLRLAAKQLR